MLENTGNSGQPPAYTTAAVKPESWQLKLPGAELGERNFGGNGASVPRLTSPGAISPLPNDASADIINPYGNIGGQNIPSDSEESRYRDYLKSTLRQAVLGNFTDDMTLLGTAAQVGLGLAGLDLPADIRDLTYDLTNWEWSPEHVGQTLLDALGLVPLIGSVKYADETAALLKGAGKHADEVADLAKGIGRRADETTEGAGKSSGKPYSGTRNPEVDFTNKRGNSTLKTHFDDYASDFGYATEAEYESFSRYFLEKPPTSTIQSFATTEGTYFRCAGRPNGHVQNRQCEYSFH